MIALVLLLAGSGRYAVRVEDAGAVLIPGPLTPLPAPRPEVAGLVPHDGALIPVLTTLCGDGAQLLVLRGGPAPFALRVEEVTGVVRVRREELLPAPAGQAAGVVAHVVGGAGGGALLLDVGVLAGGLTA